LEKVRLDKNADSVRVSVVLDSLLVISTFVLTGVGSFSSATVNGWNFLAAFVVDVGR
jgi:hypothetical protein